MLPHPGMVEGGTVLPKPQPPSASPRKKLRKEGKELKRQPQRRAPPPPPAGAKVKEVSFLHMYVRNCVDCHITDVSVV